MVRLDIAEPGRYYDGEQTIVMRRGLLLCEERRYLWHEVVHADRRDTAGHSCREVEQAVEREAARRAMPWRSIEWAWRQAHDLDEMADLLKVPADWVWFRVMNLPDQRKALLRLG